ncbi:D-alanyl-D-alanine carboxypeptidase/D-alanyl-D-alanine-endopeptidase [Novosphingobium sp. TH158]|uniref:D-alanyl-D-alanine carboxypeptidase/D-alanyl-D-alanine endopeptidase n=1 Tax=Novosphingobium sp. TH158 TaxID=2067455 RepID=UPI0020B120A7|nr:D-alanyl-D-alanine carboxypeptidase/D-alanyl-D-alanine-endopeptidase [Novosphingobium sp. TH158]
MQRILLTLAIAAIPLPALAQPGPQAMVEQVLAEAGPGTRWGMVVVDEQGREVVAIAPEGRFIPASNTKLFTTAAAFWKLPALDQPDQPGGASVWLVPGKGKVPSVELVGRGDARLSSADDCKAACLSQLADAIAAKTRKVHDITGDDTRLVDQRWSPGMSWNNIPTRSGTATSALTLDDNEAKVVVTPGAEGAPPTVALPAYLTPDIRARTVASGPSALSVDRLPGSRRVQVWGTIAAGAPRVVTLGIDDPADYAAWKLGEMLKARGVKVTGTTRARHRIDPQAMAIEDRPPPLATVLPPPLFEDLTRINKESQNLHTELLLRRVGMAVSGLPQDASVEGGQKVVSAMLKEAGLKPHQFTFADGSGMSTYNRVAPRGVVGFLRWTQSQPWGAQFRQTLPIGGTDGTLVARFKATLLEGRIFAKTGTLNATNALAGFLTTKSGKTYTFAAYANDVPEGVMATRTMDKALILLAETQ